MRVRFRFAKLGKVRFTGQLDVARMWERALRRARLPVAYTEGFSPRPRLSFGLALPTGCESEAEYLDVMLDPRRPETPEVDAGTLPDRLTPLLPDGVSVLGSAELEPSRGSLQQQVTSCSWSVDVAGVTPDRAEAFVSAFLDAPSVLVPRERRGRTVEDDVRTPVRSLRVDRGAASIAPASGSVRLVAELATQPRGVRPLELVKGIAAAGGPATGGDGGSGTTPVLHRARRTEQWIERDGLRVDPLEWGRLRDADCAGHALERAS